MSDLIKSDVVKAAAHGYAARGWSVIPVWGARRAGRGAGAEVRCMCARETCEDQGKHPIRARWTALGTMSGADIEEAWTAVEPDANVGIRTGKPSGFFVLDVDPDHDGDVALAALVDEHGELPETWSQQTGSGGQHFAFLMPADFEVTNSSGRLPPGLDVRGTGGMIVAAPSVSGRGPYAVTRDGPVLAAPGWLLDLIRPTVIERETVPAEELPERAELDETTQARLDAYTSAAVDRIVERYEKAPRGGGNAAMFLAACQLFELANSPWSALTVPVVRDRLDQARRRRNRQTDREFEATWGSARNRVAGRGRPMPASETGGEFFPFPARSDETGAARPAETAGDGRTPRRLLLTSAADIVPEPVVWAWDGWVPCGALSLLAGREGCGKSTMAYGLLAKLTRGTLPGAHLGTPKAVIICAGEDSWAHTVVPRLMAADADLGKVYRIDAVDVAAFGTTIRLPRDTEELTTLVGEYDVAAILLDPFMSVLAPTMKANDYQEVYAALGPVIRMAERTGIAVVGIMHMNKSSGNDPLTRLMASRAFAAAPRSILMCHPNTDGDGYLLGHEKCNLGKRQPTQGYLIDEVAVTGRLSDGSHFALMMPVITMTGASEESIEEVISTRHRATRSGVAQRVTDGTRRWIVDYLTGVGGEDSVPAIREAATAAGHAWGTVEQLRTELIAAGRIEVYRPGRNAGPYSWRLVAGSDKPG